MKVKAIIILILFLFHTNLQARENFYGLQYDRLLHFSISGLISIGIVQWEKSRLGFFGYKTQEDYGMLSIGIPLTCGIVKEIFDARNNKGNFLKSKESWHDLTAGIVGALFGKLLTYTW
jgi:hypothetical protein